VVAVVADTDVSWHRITLPKASAARQRAALAGVLEEQLLDEPEALHLAVAPDAVGGRSTWVAVLDKAWFSGELRALEKAGVQVDRAVPVSWPEDTPLGHFSSPFGADAAAPMQLTWSDANGVAAISVQGRWRGRCSLDGLRSPRAGPRTRPWPPRPSAGSAPACWF